eukprot:CAMPEP_0176476674 /NCGR_PEP_ID=MMETSP0200_2-20121128/185_1 /TAXON_ID=947934 /ORGANISM="Chaetoceros sp., Strain GSL56" /LENGTH=926 /DNA_ID=CAMNT_0017872373 /DNA_START=723 /DNA_END=3501 /DNA_ORIENTATION=-
MCLHSCRVQYSTKGESSPSSVRIASKVVSMFCFESESISLGKRCWDLEENIEPWDTTTRQQLDSENQSSENSTTTTPPEQKRIKKSQRRRSLAIQNGRLLLSAASSSNSSSSSITFSPQATFSISSSNCFSSQSKEGSVEEKFMQHSSFSDHDHRDGVTIQSADGSSDSHDMSKLPVQLPTIRRSARIRKSMAMKERYMLNKEDGECAHTCSEKIERLRFRLSTLSPLGKENLNLTPLVEKHTYSVSFDILDKGSTQEQSCVVDEIASKQQSRETCGSVVFRLSTLSPIIPNQSKESERKSSDHELTEEPDQTSAEYKSVTCTCELSSVSPIGINNCDNATISSSVCHEIKEMSLNSPKSNIETNAQEKQSNCKEERAVSHHSFTKKPKQRRRSSLGLHVGGMISLKDLEAIQNEVAARKTQSEVLVVKEKMNEPKCLLDSDSNKTQARPPRLEESSDEKKIEVMSNAKHDSPTKQMERKESNILNGQENVSAQSRHPDPGSITIRQIKEEMLKIFRDLNVDSIPCVSSRLFSCAMVCYRRAGQNPESFKPLYPLLRSFVEAEIAALENLTVEKEASRKRIHFCSHDFSSMITPVDTATESSNIIEACIWKLQTVIKEIENISVPECRANNLNLMEDLIKTFDELENGMFEDNASAVAPSRFRKALQQYRQEFAYIISTMDTSDRETPVSFVRKTLGDFIGRIIRFHLRRLFNPVPLPLYSDGDDLPDYSHTRSRVHTLVEMIDEGGRDTATADGSISSVIGTALNRIIEFFELNKELLEREGRRFDEGYCNSFCNRPATTCGLTRNGCVITLSDEDISEVLLDIREGHSILAGVRACRFMKGLLTWPGVSEAICEVGGWAKIETFSKIFLKYRLDKEMPEECHFTLLADVAMLLNKIRNEESQLLTIEQKCEDGLRALWKRFRCG